jgi:formylglycine-generating enzyme required for sulfatase activity
MSAARTAKVHGRTMLMTSEVKQTAINKPDPYPALKQYLSGVKIVTGGMFQMGTSDKSLKSDVKHTVTISDFRMASYPVTNEVWSEYCSATQRRLPPRPDWGFIPNHPVVNVSWQQIMDEQTGFCAWVWSTVKIRVALPTEAQFEYATRSGMNGTIFPWGNAFDPSKLWCSTEKIGDARSTAPVNRKNRVLVNDYGLTDMTGNVWQWCLDWYQPYTNKSRRNPLVTKESMDDLKCIRGGGWDIKNPFYFQVCRRYWNYRRNYDDNIGFRLVVK